MRKALRTFWRLYSPMTRKQHSSSRRRLAQRKSFWIRKRWCCGDKLVFGFNPERGEGSLPSKENSSARLRKIHLPEDFSNHGVEQAFMSAFEDKVIEASAPEV